MSANTNPESNSPDYISDQLAKHTPTISRFSLDGYAIFVSVLLLTALVGMWIEDSFPHIDVDNQLFILALSFYFLITSNPANRRRSAIIFAIVFVLALLYLSVTLYLGAHGIDIRFNWPH